ncbi:MAG: conjugal transfer protein TraC, partial [Rhodospirillales bacterium]|nr:conjugal transfer protein TraC [Rhodospirillales bacterium]
VGTAGISSDDPDAVVKLSEKLEELEKKQQLYKAINKALRKADRTGSDEELRELGLSDKTIAELKTPDFAGYRGIPSYVLSNNSSNMRRIRQRIEALRASADDRTSEEVHGGIRIVDNVEENRVQVFFPGVPSPEVRSKLKQNGFRWSPTAGAWQRHRSEAALWWARRCCGVE